jgi:hypothetical protein
VRYRVRHRVQIQSEPCGCVGREGGPVVAVPGHGGGPVGGARGGGGSGGGDLTGRVGE